MKIQTPDDIESIRQRYLKKYNKYHGNIDYDLLKTHQITIEELQSIHQKT